MIVRKEILFFSPLHLVLESVTKKNHKRQIVGKCKTDLISIISTGVEREIWFSALIRVEPTYHLNRVCMRAKEDF